MHFKSSKLIHNS